MTKTEMSYFHDESGQGKRMFIDTEEYSDIVTVTICPKTEDSVIGRFFVTTHQLELLILATKGRQSK